MHFSTLILVQGISMAPGDRKQACCLSINNNFVLIKEPSLLEVIRLP